MSYVVSTPGAEEYLGHKPNYSNIANRAIMVESDERTADKYNESRLQASKNDLAGAGAAADSTRFAGMMQGIGSAVSGGLGALGKTNIGTNRGVTKYSQPHASGIGREARGGYDI